MPIKTYNGYKQEKGIDVWLALEAFEQAFYKRFNVVVLIASDGDYAPLVRKLNTLGTRVMVLSWDFEYTTDSGQTFVTRTSQDLLEEVSYPLSMHEIIDNRLRKNEALVNNLFVQTENKRAWKAIASEAESGGYKTSEILSIKNGFGFIKYPPNNLFFHYTNVVDSDFNELKAGDDVEFTIEKNQDDDFLAKNFIFF